MGWLNQLLRIPYVHGLWQRFPIGDIRSRVDHGIFQYPNYAYGVYWSAYLAARRGIRHVTAIELGVAGGRGLLALEKASLEIGRALDVQIDVVGFDTGTGMPPPLDYRDLPHIWREGFYKMEPEKLRARLTTAQLILGDVAETTRKFIESAPAPLAFISFDLDYYSSTKAAFHLLEGGAATHLPRVHCYFDDVASNNLGCMNPHVGELLAISEFNESHANRKICRFEQLRLARERWEVWQDRIYVFHDFAHPDYTKQVIPNEPRHTQRPL